jgi:hypothetical protein
MEPRPSGEANSRLATQEIPSYFMKPEDSHRVHKSPPLVYIVNQTNSAPTFTSCLTGNHFSPLFFQKEDYEITLLSVYPPPIVFSFSVPSASYHKEVGD